MIQRYITIMYIALRLQIAYLTYFLLFIFLQTYPVSTSYTKVQYLTRNQIITSLANCKTSSNLIFTTYTKLIHWTAYQKIQQYDIPSGSYPPFNIACSKYTTGQQHAYLVMHDAVGNVYLWQQVVSTFSLYMNFKGKMEFRVGSITHVTVGLYYVALGYNGLKVIDIVKVQSQHTTITLSNTSNLLALNYDTKNNLAVLIMQNNIITLNYYINPYESTLMYKTLISLPFLAPYTLDYQYQQNTIKFLVSNANSSFTVTFNYDENIFSSLDSIGSFYLPKLCDGNLAYSTSSQIIKKYFPTLQQQQSIITIQNPIQNYVCSTDTGSYLFSQFFIVSTDGYSYYIDCYYDVTIWAYFIQFGIVCCCCCLRLGANILSRGMCRCRELGECIVFFFMVFCWCPTMDNIDDIQQSLEK